VKRNLVVAVERAGFDYSKPRSVQHGEPPIDGVEDVA
jgi:hypothetical protein